MLTRSLCGAITPLLEQYKINTPGVRKKYDKIAFNGRFGSFYYRDIPGSKHAQIEVDPAWVAQNIVEMILPVNLQSLPQFKGIKSLKVNKLVLREWEKVFSAISKDHQLLDLIDDLDPGTFYPRHIRKNINKGISNHSWGAAIDINVGAYPLGSKIEPKEEVEEPNLILYEKVFKPAGFGWGNRYNDPMHFEIS